MVLERGLIQQSVAERLIMAGFAAGCLWLAIWRACHERSPRYRPGSAVVLCDPILTYAQPMRRRGAEMMPGGGNALEYDAAKTECEETADETSFIYRRRERRARRFLDCRTIDRPVSTRDQVAPRRQLAEEPGYPLRCAEYLAKRVAEATDNKFQIRVFAGGEIVPALQVLDAVQNNTVELGHTASYYYVGKDPTFSFDCTIPFGMNTRQMNAWMMHGGGLQLMRELFKDYNVYNIPAGNTGAQMGGWYRKEIKTVADLNGLKFRIAGLAGAILTKLGVVPQVIPGGDIYPALEKGTIDAAEWVGPYDDEKLGFYKVAKYYYYPGWWEGNAQLSLYVNIGQWESLPKAYQAILTAACAEADMWTLAKSTPTMSQP
jgi:TRAP-type C4-dicarboxylate transport system substrate-binding protein